MNPGSLVKLRPNGPWRIGPESGARDRVETLYHGDSVYSAVTGAMLSLGLLEEWLEATARNGEGAAVRFSSLFPFQGETRFVVPPKTVWPPAVSAKVRWKAARFIPLTLVQSLVGGGAAEEDRWTVDGASECLLPHGRPAPFRVAVRAGAAVDRMGAGVAPHGTGCLEFSNGCGLWAAIWYADEAAKAQWQKPVEAAFRLLADSGFGGERSRGWGRAEAPEFVEGALPDLILTAAASEPAGVQAYWLLSLFAANAADAIDWEHGFYDLTARGGRVESPARSGETKKLLHMISEGSVLHATGELRGLAVDVAPEGFPHAVYRAGFALAIPIPQVAL